MKTAGYIDMLPYSRDGFVINGFKDSNGVLRMNNMRIYKQRSMNMFDLIDISTDTIYQKVEITTTVGDTKEVLDYGNTDVLLTQQIKKNSFFIRNFDKQKKYYGFIIRVMKNKVTIDSSINVSHYIFNYDLYIRDEPKIFSLTYSNPNISDTSFNAIVNGQFLDPATIKATITTSDGTVYHGSTNGFQISFNPIVFVGTSFDILVEAEGAIDYKETIQIDGSVVQYNNVTDEIITTWFDNGNGSYSHTILPQEHGRGTMFTIQTFDNTTNDMEFVQAKLDYTGSLTITKSIQSDTKVVIAGDSHDLLITEVSIIDQDWIPVQGGYQYSIPSSSVPSEFGVFNIWVDNGTQYELAYSELKIDFNNNIILESATPYNGKLVLI